MRDPFSDALARVRHGLLDPRVQENDRCGAKTRRGTCCARKALANGRCRNHGGLSTGARTEAGRRRIAAAQRRRWAEWRAAQ